MKQKIAHYIPLILSLICLLFLASNLLAKPYADQAFDLNAFSQFPVLHQGRIKPLDSFARNSLKLITDKQVFTDTEGHKQPAIRWLIDVMSNKKEVADYQIFRIEHDEVLLYMGLEARKGFRYSLSELMPKYEDLIAKTRIAIQKDAQQQDLVDKKTLELYNQLETYRQVMQFEVPLVLPPEHKEGKWLTLGAEKQDFSRTSQANVWYQSLKSYQTGDVDFFNTVGREYMASLKKNHSELFPRLLIEHKFNIFQPFYQAIILLVIVFLLSVFSWLFWEEPLRKSALNITIIATILFTVALILRMYLQGRPPVTNLYSSAIFVGWCSVLLGLAVEWYLRNGFGTVMASITGFLSLLVAQNLAGDGDTMEMMRAVLDTNFWLATHVTTVTIGYSATLLAGFMGLVLILMGVLTRKLEPELYNKISGMIYGIVAFALLFSFVGTVLGGIWADQSWGRFWGWDPKENGAVIIVLWNAIILHARWGGIARKRGIALLAIGGNIVTAWSWFGVNMLGVGLHSYGFTDKAFIGLLSFVFVNLLVIAIGFIPEEKWRSPIAIKKTATNP